MTQVKRRNPATQKPAATIDRNFRTFMLVAQLEARAIGARIKQARKESGMTQEELADLAAGFSKRSLQDYENGVTIPYKHLREISTLLDRPVEWFLHGEPAKTPAEDSVENVLAQHGEQLERIESLVAQLVERGEQPAA